MSIKEKEDGEEEVVNDNFAKDELNKPESEVGKFEKKEEEGVFGVSYNWEILPVEEPSPNTFTTPGKLANCRYTGTHDKCEKYIADNKPEETEE